MLIMTSAACDARMDGAMIPVMSNSGSGNQKESPLRFRFFFRRGYPMLGRATDPCVDVKPFDGDLYQAKSGTLVRPLRFCGCRYGSELRYHLFDGRK